MASKSVQNSPALSESIKMRRKDLGLTIEGAAEKAGVGTKTWSRYEAGASIRQDKCKGVCKALNWVRFPGTEDNMDDDLNLDEYKTHKAWSKYLEDLFGTTAALSFVAGSEILLDHIDEDMRELSKMPKGSHVGQIEFSLLTDLLPPQFLMEYDYDFLYLLGTSVKRFQEIAHMGRQIIAHSVLDELALNLVIQESRMLLEEMDTLDDDWDEWIFDVFGDMDLITFLFSGHHLTDEDPYHYSHWTDNQFHTE